MLLALFVQDIFNFNPMLVSIFKVVKHLHTMMTLSPALEALAVALRIPIQLSTKPISITPSRPCHLRRSALQRSSFSTTSKPRAGVIGRPQRDPRISMPLLFLTNFFCTDI